PPTGGFASWRTPPSLFACGCFGKQSLPNRGGLAVAADREFAVVIPHRPGETVTFAGAAQGADVALGGLGVRNPVNGELGNIHLRLMCFSPGAGTGELRVDKRLIDQSAVVLQFGVAGLEVFIQVVESEGKRNIPV